jgi:hypothetical protein
MITLCTKLSESVKTLYAVRLIGSVDLLLAVGSSDAVRLSMNLSACDNFSLYKVVRLSDSAAPPTLA